MIDHFVVLPPETEKLLKRLIALYKKHWNNEALYKQGLNEIAEESDSSLFDRVETLVKSRYLRDNDRCIPTDIGISYSFLKRMHYMDRYFFPASISIAVSIITTLITIWIKGQLCN
ncbi:MAG: hypothetical protein J6M62_02445 [Selenomonadaceae bacterium]|nr:hypothetical protein [Selenomonadaceae bacterium]MBP3723785.1 hypothetical protein [Selenomonadaceae bacterium]